MTSATLPRMRIRRGRVMHRVESNGPGCLRSLCRRRVIRGAASTVPRAWGPADDWSTERHWYPDCRHCPAEKHQANPYLDDQTGSWGWRCSCGRGTPRPVLPKHAAEWAVQSHLAEEAG